MAVGADVLDGGAAGEAGDFAHGFDAGEVTFASVLNHVVPIFTAHDFELTGSEFGDSAHAVNDDDAIETFIVAEGVSTITKDESREMVLSSKTVGFGEVFGAFDFDNISSGATETHGGEAGN